MDYVLLTPVDIKDLAMGSPLTFKLPGVKTIALICAKQNPNAIGIHLILKMMFVPFKKTVQKLILPAFHAPLGKKNARVKHLT